MKYILQICVGLFYYTTSNIPLMLGYGTYKMYKICFIHVRMLVLLHKVKYTFYVPLTFSYSCVIY